MWESIVSGCQLLATLVCQAQMKPLPGEPRLDVRVVRHVQSVVEVHELALQHRQVDHQREQAEAEAEEKGPGRGPLRNVRHYLAA